MKYLLILGVLFIGAAVLEFYPEHSTITSAQYITPVQQYNSACLDNAASGCVLVR